MEMIKSVCKFSHEAAIETGSRSKKALSKGTKAKAKPTCKTYVPAASDERFTPPILVEPILPYIPANSTIWCPFDTEDSEFVRILTREGHKVIYSHIWDGKDFFTYEPDEPYDYIISNPPFSRKLEVFQRLAELGKPFAVCMTTECLNYQNIGSFFTTHNLELLIPDKKVSYDGKTCSFNTSYFCNGMLPEKLIFTHLPHNNTNADFVGSKMTVPTLTGISSGAVALSPEPAWAQCILPS